MKINKSKLRNILELPGISGREEKISNFIIESIKSNNLKLIKDNLGSVWGFKKSKNKNAKTILIDAHMDEVGFIVTSINKNGMIRFEKIGGIWNNPLNYQRVNVWNFDLSSFFKGVIFFKNSNSHKGEGQKNIKINDMLIDIGIDSKEKVEKLGIKIGSSITFDSETILFNNKVISKSVDNRVGLFSIIEIMEYIKNKDFDFNIYIGSTVQEEVGLRGAKTSSYKIKPDLAIVVDISPALDINEKSEPYGVLGKGTIIRHKDASVIFKRKIINYLKDISNKNNIKTQDYISSGSTNSGIIEIMNDGISVIPIGIVARNLHTASSIFNINDYYEMVKLLELILNDLDSNKIVKLN